MERDNILFNVQFFYFQTEQNTIFFPTNLGLEFKIILKNKNKEKSVKYLVCCIFSIV